MSRHVRKCLVDLCLSTRSRRTEAGRLASGAAAASARAAATTTPCPRTSSFASRRPCPLLQGKPTIQCHREQQRASMLSSLDGRQIGGWVRKGAERNGEGRGGEEWGGDYTGRGASGAASSGCCGFATAKVNVTPNTDEVRRVKKTLYAKSFIPCGRSIADHLARGPALWA